MDSWLFKFVRLFLGCLWWSLPSACWAVPIWFILLQHMRNLTLGRRACGTSIYSLLASRNMFEGKTIGIVYWVYMSRRTSKNCIDIVAHLDCGLNMIWEKNKAVYLSQSTKVDRTRLQQVLKELRGIRLATGGKMGHSVPTHCKRSWRRETGLLGQKE
jgi:hypothetical protein